MKKILYSDFDDIGSVLDSVVKNSDLQYGIKKSVLTKFWSKVVGKKFENYSKPASLNRNGILTVACANAAITNELTMFKQDILKKLEPYSKSLDLKIEDIIFSHKIWVEEKTEQTLEVSSSNESFIKKESEEVLINYDEIELDEAEIQAIQNCINNNKFASEEQRERMFEAILKDLKYQKFIATLSSSCL